MLVILSEAKNLTEIQYNVIQMGHELVQRSQFQLFTGRMDAAESGAEGNHIQVRELLQEQAAFQTGVDGFHFGSWLKSLR